MELYTKTESKELDPITTEIIQDSDYKKTTIALFAAYDISSILSVNMELPYVAAEKKAGNQKIKNSSVGDISFGLKCQLTDQKNSYMDIFFNVTTLFPTGDSPYKIDPWAELATGSGGYSVTPEVTFAKTIKKTLLFCSIFYKYNLAITGLKHYQYETDGESGIFLDNVERGGEFGSSIGFVERLHEKMSWMLSYNLHRAEPVEYNWNGRDDYESASSDFTTVSSGFAFQMQESFAVFTIFTAGVGEDAPDYEFKLSIAF